jgi:hypothetical protein
MNKDNLDLKNLCIIELSEFNVDLLTQATQLYPLANLAQILQFKKSSYKTNDRYNSGYLTPTIQWDAIHAGVSSRKIPPSPKFFWEVLNEQGISTALWGIQNTATAYEPIHGLPRFWDRCKKNVSLLKNALKLKCTFKMLKAIILFKFKKAGNVPLLVQYLSWQDLVSALLFCKLKKKQKPQCSILFLRSLAYTQHNHWEGNDKHLNTALIYNLKIIDRILGHLMKQFPMDSFIIHNALSQIKVQKTFGSTGQYVSLGTTYSQTLHFPNHIFNYEFNQYVYHYFLPETYRLKSEYIEDELALM